MIWRIFFSIKEILCQKWRQVSAFGLPNYWMLDIKHWTGNPITWLLIRCIFYNLGEKKAKWNMRVHWEPPIKAIKKGCGILNFYTWLESWLTRLDSPGSGCAGQFFIFFLISNASLSLWRIINFLCRKIYLLWYE